MEGELTLRLTAEDERELHHLCAATGFLPEVAAIYALRLVSACVREGLFTDMPSSVWPEEARLCGAGEERMRPREEECCGAAPMAANRSCAAGGKLLRFRRGGKEEDF